MALARVAFGNAGLNASQPVIGNEAAITANEVLLAQDFLGGLELNLVKAHPTVTHAELQAYRLFSLDIHERRMLQLMGALIGPAVAAGVAPFSRAIAQNHNRSIFQMTESGPLMQVPNIAGVNPPGVFPADIPALTRLSSANTNALLAFYGNQAGGNLANRKRALMRELGDERRHIRAYYLK